MAKYITKSKVNQQLKTQFSAVFFTAWSLQSKGLSRVFSNTTVQPGVSTLLPLPPLFPQTVLTGACPPHHPEGWPSHPHLDEHLAQEGHDKGWVHAAEPAHSADGQLPDLKHLVIQSHEQGLQVLRLGQVCIKALIQGRTASSSHSRGGGVR